MFYFLPKLEYSEEELPIAFLIGIYDDLDGVFSFELFKKLNSFIKIINIRQLQQVDDWVKQYKIGFSPTRNSCSSHGGSRRVS